VRRSAEALRKVETNLIGAVLNAVDFKRSAYGDQYYASYEYAETSESTEKSSSSRSSR
jgi:Mrp family chromosome partitioning ATPase